VHWYLLYARFFCYRLSLFYCFWATHPLYFRPLHGLGRWKGIKLEPSTTYHPQTDGQSEIANKVILQEAWACQVEGNEWLPKLSEIQLKVNFWDNTARQHSSIFLFLDFEALLGPSSFPYLVTTYIPAEERHFANSRNLYSSKVKEANQTNKKRSIPPLLSEGQMVLLSMENINLLNTSRKLKPRWVRLFRIKHVNKKGNIYQLTYSRLSLIHNTFHLRKIKP